MDFFEFQNSIKIFYSNNPSKSTKIEKIFCEACVEEITFQASTKHAIDRHIQKTTHQIKHLFQQVVILNKILNEKNEEISILQNQINSFNQQFEIFNLKMKVSKQEIEIMNLTNDLFKKNLEISDYKNEIINLTRQNESLQEKNKSISNLLTFPVTLPPLIYVEDLEIPQHHNTSTFQNINHVIKLHKQKKLETIVFTKTVVKLFIELGIPLNTLKDQNLSFYHNNENEGKTVNETITRFSQNTLPIITTKQKTVIKKKKECYISPIRFLLEQLAQCSLYKITYMRQLVDEIAQEVIDNSRKLIGQHDIFIMSDSTPMRGYNIENVFIGVLSTTPIKPILIQCNFSNSSMTGEHISQIIKNTLDNFFKHQQNYEHRVRFFISDQASNMIKCGAFLKIEYQNMMHLSCIVHALHNVCVTIINNTLHIKSFIQLMNSTLSNNIKHISFFKRIFNKSIPATIMTRFGSYLQASFFYFENFSYVELYLNTVLSNKSSTENAQYYSKIKNLLENSIYDLYNELESIYQFQFITRYITDLEMKNMELKKQFEIIEHVRFLLTGDLKDRLNEIMLRNPDYNKLLNLMMGEKLDDSNLKYLSLSTVDVERSFSILRKVLNDRTSKMTNNSINNYMVIRYNKLIEYVE